MRLEEALDEVAPFAAIFAADGRCLHIGRSLRKVCGIEAGTPGFYDLFRITKPMALRDTRDLAAACGRKTHLQTMRELNGTPIGLRASIAALDDCGEAFLVFTSLGADLPPIVEALGLTDGDFSHADPAVDLLYLVKTQSGLILDSQALAQRLKQAKDTAETQALTDTLTGLPNRRALGEFAAEFLRRDGPSRGPAFLLHVDLDRFKQVNDKLGHAAGDLLLQRVTSDLRSAAQAGDYIARIGGDEFILILTSAPDLDAAKSVGRRLIDRIGLPVDVEGQSAEVGASVGITTIPAGCEKSLDTLLKEADVALYDVKNAGRGAVSVFTRELEDREARVKQLIRDIEPAIARGEFVPFYQLQVDVATGMVFGAEVLGRWQHPELGLILPQQFLEVAERAQLVEKIDAAIFAQALDNLAAWSRQGIAPPHLSLNLTFRKLTGGNFAERFRDEVDARGLHPSQIIFELIELILIDEETVAIHEAAEMLHRNGFKLAIDDFGTGRASLMSLLSVPASIVKIDRSFVSNLDQFPKKMLMTEAIMNIARALGLNVIAEGTETEKECAILLGLGCTIFQGFLFNRPEPALRFERTLRDAEWRAAFPAAVDMRAVFDSSA